MFPMVRLHQGRSRCQWNADWWDGDLRSHRFELMEWYDQVEVPRAGIDQDRARVSRG